MEFFYPLTAFLNAITSFILGGLVLANDKKSSLNRIFFLLALSVTFWSGCYFLWQISTEYEIAFFWLRLLMVGAILIPITYLHFVILFLQANNFAKTFLRLGYAISFLYITFDLFTNSFIDDVTPKLSFAFWPEAGPMLLPYLITFVGLFLYSWYLLFKAHKVASGLKKKQIEYILFGPIIGVLGGSTNFPLWYNIPLPPIGNALVIIFVGTIAYAIIHQKLFEMKIIFVQFLVGAIAILFSVQLFTAKTPTEYISQGTLLITFLIAGYLLIQGVLKEAKAKEQIEQLAGKLEVANTELARINQAKSDFISMASHQLKTPLSIIKGYVSMTLEGSFGNITKKIKEQLEKVFISNERLISLVEDLLNLSRVEAGRMKYDWTNENISDIVQQVVEEVRIAVEHKGLKLIWKPPPEKLYARVDLNKMRNVIFNMADNAIKYTDKGTITVTVTPHNQSVRVSVADTGRGISASQIQKLFTKFTRVIEGTSNLTTVGFGLGLYVARLIVDEHKGRIWAESAGLGKGSAFLMEGPLVELKLEKDTKSDKVEQSSKVKTFGSPTSES